jgi:hypothetical protein
MGRGKPEYLRGFTTQLLYCRQEIGIRQPRRTDLSQRSSRYKCNGRGLCLLALTRGDERLPSWSEAAVWAYNYGISAGRRRILIGCEVIT